MSVPGPTSTPARRPVFFSPFFVFSRFPSYCVLCSHWDHYLLDPGRLTMGFALDCFPVGAVLCSVAVLSSPYTPLGSSLRQPPFLRSFFLLLRHLPLVWKIVLVLDSAPLVRVLSRPVVLSSSAGGGASTFLTFSTLC